PRRVLSSTRVVCDRALREQRDRSPLLFFPALPRVSGSVEYGRRGRLLLRASNEHCLIVRVLRARKPAPAPIIPYPHTLFKTSRYASSIFPKSFRNRSLSIDSFVVASQKRQVSGEISSARMSRPLCSPNSNLKSTRIICRSWKNGRRTALIC